MFNIASAPFAHNRKQTQTLMLLVILACLPGLLAQIWFFGWGSLIQILLALVTALGAEALVLKLRRRPIKPALMDGSAALTAVLIEYGRSACEWASRLVFVNGHGGNAEALRAAVRLLRTEGRDAVWTSASTDGGDAHAGHTETSLLLYLSPHLVLVERFVAGNVEPLPELMARMRRGGVAAVSASGVLGDPGTATAAAGEQLFAGMVADCAARILRWAPDDVGMLT